MKTIMFSLKWPSLIAKTDKFCITELKKSLVRLTSEKNQFIDQPAPSSIECVQQMTLIESNELYFNAMKR